MQELGKLGWRKSGPEALVWSADGLQVRLYHPEKARGLEFEAVVVVEPRAFPDLAAQARIELARVHIALADLAGARTLLREVDELLRRRPGLGNLAGEAKDL